MRAEWVRSLRDQCDEAEVAFFFKQWGGVRKSTTGRELDGRTYDDFPHYSLPPGPDASTRRRLRLATIAQ